MTTLPVIESAPTVLDESRASALAHRFGVLADPVRLRLLAMVATNPIGEVCACVLPDAVGRSQSTVSHHMGRLVEAGLVARIQRGKWAWYRAEPEALDQLRDTLGHELRHRARRPCLLVVDMDGAGRSWMAAAWLRHLAPDAVEVVAASAGPGPGEPAAEPAGVPAVMAEVGVDVTGAVPQAWTTGLAAAADLVVCIGCDEPDGVPPGTRVVRWDVAQGSDPGPGAASRMRDELRSRVDELVAEFTPACCVTAP